MTTFHDLRPEDKEALALRLVDRALDRLDVEEDDRVRCDLITDLQDLADEHGGAVAAAVKAGGVPIT